MPVMIRDEHFERKIQRERDARGHKSLAKTVQELAEERLIEIEVGRFVQPAPPKDESDSALSSES